MIALFKNPRVWLALALVVALGVAAGQVLEYGKKQYQKGLDDMELSYRRAAAESNQTAINELLNLQAETYTFLTTTAERATLAQRQADERASALHKTLRDLRNEQESDCVRVNPGTLRVLNRAACEYNARNGYLLGDASGVLCSTAEPPGETSGAMRRNPHGSVAGH